MSPSSAQECFLTLSAYLFLLLDPCILHATCHWWKLKINHHKMISIISTRSIGTGRWRRFRKALENLWYLANSLSLLQQVLCVFCDWHPFSKHPLHHSQHHSQHLYRSYTYINGHDVVTKLSLTNLCKSHEIATFPWVLPSPFSFFIKLQVFISIEKYEWASETCGKTMIKDRVGTNV